MYVTNCDVAVIGAGPAGLAAAVAAKKEGAKRVVVVERDRHTGGILQQCIHPGFGLTYFNEELTGPEYAERFSNEAEALGVEIILNSMVLEILPEEHEVIFVNSTQGVTRLKAEAIVLSMGCRERTRPNILIPGSRPAGVYTAGAAQRLINKQNAMVGKRVVILGSGDIGMIMARRMTLEGAEVIAVVEIMDFLAGLTRNKVQCLDDFDIPLLLQHTVTKIMGNNRVEGVTVAKVDENRQPIPGTEQHYDCDTLLLSVGLIPENELSQAAGIALSPVTKGPVVDQHMETSVPGIFACGNVVHVNDLVDNVTTESERAGKFAAMAACCTLPEKTGEISITPGFGVRYVSPQYLTLSATPQEVELFFRVTTPMENVRTRVVCNGDILSKKKRIRINPGEMESLKISTDKIHGNEITVEVQQEVSE